MNNSNITISKKITVTQITYVGLFVSLIAICSWISIPFALPFTMQTFAIVTTVALLDVKLSMITISVYICLGALGLPIFSGAKGGLGVLLGLTGGYIIGFVFTILVTGIILNIFGRKVISMFIAMILGIIVCYVFGTIWFMVIYAQTVGTIDLYTALSMCVFPFIIPDICKILIAIPFTKRISKFVKVQ